MNNELSTRFAPAERADRATIDRQARAVTVSSHVREVLSAISQVALLVNQQRQIVHCNQSLLDMLGITDVSQILGQRPGEMLNCLHANDQPSGCGTSEACAMCGAVNAILAAQAANCPVTRECRLSVQRPDGIAALDLRVHVAPLTLLGEKFYLVSLIDISDEKRRRLLERIFFHDLINTASAIEGLVNVVVQSDYDAANVRELLPLVNRSSRQLVEEIIAQRVLTQAENGELRPVPVAIVLPDLLQQVIDTYARHQLASRRTLLLAPVAAAGPLTADPVILRRVVANLVKNALEATPEGSTITISAANAGGRMELAVHNPGVIPADVQLQIFQRSFSTKGANRGLGTYSIKLLTERYLGGTVAFSSSAADGTTFRIALPLAPS